MFSCEFCEIFKSTFFIEHLWWLLLESNETFFIFIWRIFQVAETAGRRSSSKKVVLKILQYSQENSCVVPTQVLSCEYCEILKNTFFIEYIWWLYLRWDQFFFHLATFLLQKLFFAKKDDPLMVDPSFELDMRRKKY